MLLGLLFSAILVIGTPAVPIQAFVGVIFVGIALGMLLSIITYSFVRRRRDYASVMQVLADHYEVTVAASSIHRARQVLGTGPAPAERSAAASRPAPAVAPPEVVPPTAAPVDPLDGPPRYGERVPPAAPAEDGPIPDGEPGGVDGGGIAGAPGAAAPHER